MENFMKICRMGAELWTQKNEDTDRHDEDSSHFCSIFKAKKMW